MKRVKKILSFMMSMAMMIGMIALDFPIIAQAANKVTISFTLKLSVDVAGGTTVPGNYNVEYAVVDENGDSVSQPADYSGEYSGVLNGSENGSEVSKTVSLEVDDDRYIKIKVNPAGNDIYIGESSEDTSAWSDGKRIAVNALAGEYQFQLQASQGSNPPPAGDPPTGNRQDVNLTVSWTGDFGEIKVGDTSIADLTTNTQHFSSVNCEQDNTIKIKIQARYSEVYSSIKIDGVEQLFNGETKDYYEFSIPKDRTSLSIVVEKGVSTQHTIIWRYDNQQGDDAMVEHGTVVMESGYHSGGDGHYLVNDDADVTIKLIPDYGYQVVGASINGDVELKANSNTNEFTFKMPHTNVHFKGIFTKTEDIVSVNAQGVRGASLTNGNAVAGSGGTAKMTVETSNSPADTSSIEGVDNSKAVQAVDIQMDQLFYKNSADDLWTQPQHELSSSAEVKLVVNQPAAGYAVLREHNGQVVEIPAYYDEATGTVTFASDKYSVFTLVPLTESNNQYDPIEVEPDVPAESESETSSEGSDEPAVLKTSGETSDNTYFVIEQQEINRNPETIILDATGVDKTGLESMPKQTYNLSSFVTAKGFMTSIDKIAKSRQGETSINIYTEQPICFTNEILQNMSKNNIDFVYYFKHKGHLYSVTIPAQIDLEAIFKNNKYAGPLYLGYVLGNSKLIK